MKVSDYLFERLADWGVRHVFMIAGGGSMHLNESLRRESRLRYICNHHEQASAMAAECYARVSGTPGVLSVTSGPGGINALNGVFGAYTDSVPMLVISGQVKRETCMALAGVPGLRQLGYQEADTVRMVKDITKYAVLVDDPADIRYHLEKAWYLAGSGRPGPCWLDIPVDVQGAAVDERRLRAYDPAEDRLEWDLVQIRRQCRDVVDRLRRSARPVILAGNGVRAAGALGEFREAIRLLRIPVTTAHAPDLIASDDRLDCGRPGIIGQRSANLTVQNSDALLVLGSRLHIRQVSYDWKSFAPRAFKMHVDVDPAELAKPLVSPDLPIHCDLKIFLVELLRELWECGYDCARHGEWLQWCRGLMERYPPVLERQRLLGPPLNPYYFYEVLFERLADDDVVVCANASAFIMPFQAARIKTNQRLIANSGSASMGYDLPAAIGAAIARAGKRVICLSGDGSLQFNIQELQTIVHHQLPVKIFVLNNGGYHSIRETQMTHFGNVAGEGPESGVSFPDTMKIAHAYGLPSARMDSASQFALIDRALEAPGPFLCEVMVDPQQDYEPRVKSRLLADGTMQSPRLEDMFPFMDVEQFAEEPPLKTGAVSI